MGSSGINAGVHGDLFGKHVPIHPFLSPGPFSGSAVRLVPGFGDRDDDVPGNVNPPSEGHGRLPAVLLPHRGRLQEASLDRPKPREVWRRGRPLTGNVPLSVRWGLPSTIPTQCTWIR